MKAITDHSVEIGDRVEIMAGNRFGKIVEILTAKTRERYLLRMPNGDHKEVGAGQVAYAPDKRELAKRCESVQSKWTALEYRSRAGLTSERDVESRYTIPIVHDEGGLLSEFYGSEVG